MGGEMNEKWIFANKEKEFAMKSDWLCYLAQMTERFF